MDALGLGDTDLQPAEAPPAHARPQGAFPGFIILIVYKLSSCFISLKDSININMSQ